MKKTIWDIKYGDMYFRIFGSGVITHDVWQECSIDLEYRDNFSAFLTREEAEAEIEARKKKAQALKPILDDAERRYLSAVVRPFRDKVDWVVKRENDGTNKEYISMSIGLDGMTFPDFKMGTMYRGMKLDKQYTLEELGL